MQNQHNSFIPGQPGPARLTYGVSHPPPSAKPMIITPQNLFDQYKERFLDDAGRLIEADQLEDFEKVDDELLTQMDWAAGCEDSVMTMEDDYEIRRKMLKIIELARDNKRAALKWIHKRGRARGKIDQWKSPFREMETDMEVSAKRAIHLMRSLAPLPFNDVKLHQVHRGQLVEPYANMKPQRVTKCHILRYNKYQELYSMEQFNRRGVGYAVSPYLTMYYKPPITKYPDDYPWDSTNEHFTDATTTHHTVFVEDDWYGDY